MVRRILPPDEVVFDLARSGVHPKEIRKMYGGGDVLYILRRTAEGRSLIRKLDSDRKKTPLKWKDTELVRLVETYSRCGCLAKTARELLTNESTVRRALQFAGVRVLTQSEAQTGPNNPFWHGGISVSDGRTYIRCVDHPFATKHGYVLRSRLVMEGSIGRYLLPKEVVHHKDDDPMNDALSNLQLFASNAEHLRETLKGKCPKWSEEGKRRIVTGASKPKSVQHKAKLRESYLRREAEKRKRSDHPSKSDGGV